MPLRVATGPLNEDRAISPHRHVSEPHIAEVVEDNRPLEGVAFHVKLSAGDPDRQQVFA